MHGHMNVKYVSDYYVIKVHSYTQVHLLVFLKKNVYIWLVQRTWNKQNSVIYLHIQ
jgi:hypothetical protein